MFMRSLVLFWCLFSAFWSNEWHAHHNSTGLSASTLWLGIICSIVFLKRHDKLINYDQSTIFTHRVSFLLTLFTFWWWRHTRLCNALWNNNTGAWRVVSDSLDIHFIYDGIHSCRNVILWTNKQLECGTWYHHPRRLQCVLSRNLRIFKVATWHYRCRHNLKNNCIWDSLQCYLLVPRSPNKPVMLTFDLQSPKLFFIEIVFFFHI